MAKSVIDRFVDDFDILRTSATPDFGVWVEGKYNSKKGMFLAHGPEGIMREILFFHILLYHANNLYQ
jgi:hypothetical protein